MLSIGNCIIMKAHEERAFQIKVRHEYHFQDSLHSYQARFEMQRLSCNTGLLSTLFGGDSDATQSTPQRLACISRLYGHWSSYGLYGHSRHPAAFQHGIRGHSMVDCCATLGRDDGSSRQRSITDPINLTGRKLGLTGGVRRSSPPTRDGQGCLNG